MEREIDVAAVRSPFVTFWILKRNEALFLIDCGFLGAEREMLRVRRERGWSHLPVRGIILTHGHLDHHLRAAEIARAHDAWIAAPRADAPHCAGRPVYRGPARVCGLLERAGRKLLSWRAYTVDHWITDGEILPECGLRAVHLPGHTAGHTGYYDSCGRRLFSGDLFASPARGAQLPPAIFNSEPEKTPASIQRALELPLAGMCPCHGDRSAPEVHLKRLQRWAKTRPPVPTA